jgi:hypothetical protein
VFYRLRLGCDRFLRLGADVLDRSLGSARCLRLNDRLRLGSDRRLRLGADVWLRRLPPGTRKRSGGSGLLLADLLGDLRWRSGLGSVNKCGSNTRVGLGDRFFGGSRRGPGDRYFGGSRRVGLGDGHGLQLLSHEPLEDLPRTFGGLERDLQGRCAAVPGLPEHHRWQRQRAFETR